MTANVTLTSQRGAAGSRRFDHPPESILQGGQDAAVSPAFPCPPRPRAQRPWGWPKKRGAGPTGAAPSPQDALPRQRLLPVLLLRGQTEVESSAGCRHVLASCRRPSETPEQWTVM